LAGGSSQGKIHDQFADAGTGGCIMKELILNWVGSVPYLNNQYVIALLIVLLSIILAKIFLFVFNKYLEHIAKKTKSEIDDLIFEHIKTRHNSVLNQAYQDSY